MEERVIYNEETHKMPVPEKSEKCEEKDDEEHRDNGETEEKEEVLPALGRLSLNVQAHPYIPKQDGAVFIPREGKNAQTRAKSELSEEAGEELAGIDSKEQHVRNATTNQKTLDGKKSETETEDELRAQNIALKQTLKYYEEMIAQYQASEQSRKREVDSVLNSAREVVEREMKEKLDVLCDRKLEQEKVEHLAKTLSILQAENDELTKLKRQQDEKLTELARLKTLIHENGFPNIEQFLNLQQQNESFRDDFFNERKERERLQSQKDKMKRELDAAQPRIASLQEQVYKYREHIFFIQNKFKQQPTFRPLPFHDSNNTRPISANEACKLYGPNATEYINHGLASSMNPVSSGASVEPKFPSRNDKKSLSGRYGETGGRQWQDGRMPRPMSGEEWKRQQSAGRNGYFNNNMNRITPSNSAPALAGMALGEPSQDMSFYDKQYPKIGFQRRSRLSLTDEVTKDFGMPPGDWSKQSLNKQGKRFSSPLPSPNLLPATTPEFWSPQQAPGLGFQKGWQSGQDEIFRFPPSPLTTPTSKSSFDSWPTPSTLTTDDQSVFSPASSASDEGNIFPLAMPSGGRNKEGNFGRFSQSNATSNGRAYVCYNCGINFDDNETHRIHVEICGK